MRSEKTRNYSKVNIMKKDKKLYNMNKKTKPFLLMNIGNYVLVLLTGIHTVAHHARL